jgi:hypothetical protein
MNTKEIVRLPDLERLELAEFKFGSLSSDVTEILSTVKTVAGSNWLERYNTEQARGQVSSFDEWQAKQPEVEKDEIRALRLLAFATDILDDISYLTEMLEELRGNTLELFRESRARYSSEGAATIAEWAGETGEHYRARGDDA